MLFFSLGIGCGIGILLDNEGSLHGKASNDAYHIGEDVCENGIVLVTALVEQRLKENETIATLIDNGGIVVNDFKTEDEPDQLYKQIVVGTLPMEAKLVETDDLRYLPKQLGLFASRHNPNTDLSTVDKSIADQFKTNFTALMYHLDLESGAEEYGATQLIVLKAIALSLLRPVFEKYHAIELEPELFVFHEASEAVLAVLDAKVVIAHYNASLKEVDKKDSLTIHGWGIHHGTMIFVDGTDIHWGDPVNTASKLGQDLATNGDLLISKSVEEIVVNDASCKGVHFESRLLKRSGVDFPAFCVTREVPSVADPVVP